MQDDQERKLHTKKIPEITKLSNLSLASYRKEIQKVNSDNKYMSVKKKKTSLIRGRTVNAEGFEEPRRGCVEEKQTVHTGEHLKV